MARNNLRRRRCLQLLQSIIVTMVASLLALDVFVGLNLPERLHANTLHFEVENNQVTENVSSEEGIQQRGLVRNSNAGGEDKQRLDPDVVNPLYLESNQTEIRKAMTLLDMAAFFSQNTSYCPIPMFYPARFVPKDGGKRFIGGSDALCANWERATPPSSDKIKRYTGVGPNAVSVSEGGMTVVGSWPDSLTQLTFIPILKNGSTRLKNAIGDLRQRINATVGRKEKLGVQKDLQHAEQWQKQVYRGRAKGHVVFTVVRDPVDRFISATCQEMLLDEKYKMKCATSDPSATLLCALKKRRHHHQPQIDQLKDRVGNVDVAVAMIPFPRIGDLLTELGAVNKKARDRKSSQYIRDRNLGRICLSLPSDLSDAALSGICKVYQNDVAMMRSIGMEVSLCDN